MPSRPFNSLSSSSSMKCSYPPTNNPSSSVRKQSKPITAIKRTPLFFLRSNSASLRLGRRCHHCQRLCSQFKGAKMVKGKPTDGGNDVRIAWKDSKEVQAFCDLSAAQVLDGKRHQGFLRKEGVDVVIEELAQMGKVVTHAQFKNKWDHLRRLWKNWRECFDRDSGLGVDPVTGIIEASDEWWTRKLQACPKALGYKNKPLPNVKSMEIMFEGTCATGRNAFCPSGDMPKECTEGSGDSDNSLEFVDPQCEPSAFVDPMEVEGPSSSRATPVVNKGKGLASSVPLFRGICKKPKKKRSVVQELSDSLKSISDVIVESRSISSRTPFASAAATEMQAIMDMVLSLPGVQAGDRLHMFSTCLFVNNPDGRNMFVANREKKDVQLKWLEMQYIMNPQWHFAL